MKNLKLDTKHLKKLEPKFYNICRATPLENPSIVSINHTLLKEMNLENIDTTSADFLDFLNGKFIASGSIPHANAYSGHQFGYFVPNLGDGRALNLGLACGYHLQLKGSGITKYSRLGDGKAVLRSSIREYLISEAMHALGIETTRALAITSSDTNVHRETIESGSMVLRASPSWVRFGSFEFAYLGEKKARHVEMLADYVIDESYPHLKNSTNRYEELYFAIVDKTMEMVAKWQSVGFMHGVMNTDNMSIAGLTIDYGPFAFMESFDKSFVCNTSDYDGRYSFEAQPYIAQWNLNALLNPFSVIADKNVMQSYLDSFIGRYKLRYFELMREKLGLKLSFEEDNTLITQLLKDMQECKVDYTNFFYLLSYSRFDDILIQAPQMKEWILSYKNRLELEKSDEQDRISKMQKINPKYVLKNYMLQEAIDKAQKNDFTLVNSLLKIAQNPHAEHKEFEHYAKVSNPHAIFKCGCSS